MSARPPLSVPDLRRPIDSRRPAVGLAGAVGSVLTTAALLVACTPTGAPGAAPVPAPTTSARPTIAPTTGSGDASEDVTTDPPSDVAAGGDEAPVLEETLQLPAGPLSGARFDVEAAADLVAAGLPAPEDSHSWSVALLDVVRGDYAASAHVLAAYDAEDARLEQAPASRSRDAREAGPAHVAIVLDASGSMAAASGAGRTRMQEAKAAIVAFSAAVPRRTTVSVRVYGQHDSGAGVSRAEACRATRVVHAGSPVGVAASLLDVRPTGWTPLARAIEATGGDLPPTAGRTVVYVVTDGLETCGGRPVEAVRRLVARGVKPIVDVVGFHVGSAQTAALRAMSDAGGGRYVDIDSPGGLERFWARDAARLGGAWARWNATSRSRIAEHAVGEVARLRRAAASVTSTSRSEEQQALEVVALLEQRGDLDPTTAGSVRSTLLDRGTAVRSWAFRQESRTTGTAWNRQTEGLRDVEDRTDHASPRTD